MPRDGNGHKPVFALDIDGTLGDYHGHFRTFAEGYLGRSLPPIDEWAGDVSFARHLRVSKPIYRQVKLAYRQGGMKRTMPVYPYAREMTVALRKAGAEVWICTTRPYLRLDNIDPDTRHWLRRHGIQYDGVLFGEKKYRDLVRIVGSGAVVAVVDDLPEMVDHASAQGVFAFLRDQPYNRPINGTSQVKSDCLRVHDLEEACAEMLGALDDWKKQR